MYVNYNNDFIFIFKHVEKQKNTCKFMTVYNTNRIFRLLSRIKVYTGIKNVKRKTGYESCIQDDILFLAFNMVICQK